jgi:hypothetical protein
MKHTRTTPEQSVILKKIGYDVPTTKFYTVSNGDTMYTADTFNHNLRELAMSAPKLVDVVLWLREVKGWFVGTEPVYTDKFHWECVVIAIPTLQLHEIIYKDTHDLALSAGIDFILTKLNEDDTHPTT